MEEKDKNKPGHANWMRYSGIGFQLAGSIALGVFIGYELDKHFHTSKPYFVFSCSLLFFLVSFYAIIKDIMKG
jgi:F0F1-type ATP synthase assembly protein I